MVIWKHRVTIKASIVDATDAHEIRADMDELAVELAKHPCFARCVYREAIKDLATCPDRFVEAAANNVLADIYDYADDNRIWLTFEEEE